MLETAAVAALSVLDREALRMEASATLAWVAKARREGAGGCYASATAGAQSSS